MDRCGLTRRRTDDIKPHPSTIFRAKVTHSNNEIFLPFIIDARRGHGVEKIMVWATTTDTILLYSTLVQYYIIMQLTSFVNTVRSHNRSPLHANGVVNWLYKDEEGCPSGEMSVSVSHIIQAIEETS